MQLKVEKESIFTPAEVEQLRSFFLVAGCCYPEKPFREIFPSAGSLNQGSAFVSLETAPGNDGFQVRSDARPAGMWISPDPARAEHDLYAYAYNNPINNIDPDGNEPTKSQAAIPIEVAKYNFSSIEQASRFYKQNEPGNRYIYTQKAGWIDLKHFFAAAEEASKNGTLEAWVKGIGVEIIQAREGDPSAFSYEDLPSNYQGLVFENARDPGQPFITQFLEFFKNLGAADPKTAPNYSDLPENYEGKSPAQTNLGSVGKNRKK
jgi:hypothetical protein